MTKHKDKTVLMVVADSSFDELPTQLEIIDKLIIGPPPVPNMCGDFFDLRGAGVTVLTPDTKECTLEDILNDETRGHSYES